MFCCFSTKLPNFNLTVNLPFWSEKQKEATFRAEQKGCQITLKLGSSYADETISSPTLTAHSHTEGARLTDR